LCSIVLIIAIKVFKNILKYCYCNILQSFLDIVVFTQLSVYSEYEPTYASLNTDYTDWTDNHRFFYSSFIVYSSSLNFFAFTKTFAIFTTVYFMHFSRKWCILYQEI